MFRVRQFCPYLCDLGQSHQSFIKLNFLTSNMAITTRASGEQHRARQSDDSSLYQ